MLKKSLLIMLLMALFTPWAAQAQSELTVYDDGTTSSSNVPFYGLWADTEGAASECVFPAESLTEMNGSTITEIKFYISSPAASAWTGTYQVYLGEVDETVLTGITGPDAFAVVKTASFDATGTELTIELDEPYVYGGGNLLIGTIVTVGGNYTSASFTGVKQEENTGWYRTGASAAGSGAKFLPKTTFTFTGSGPVCERPATMEASNVTTNSAKLTWTGGSGNYNVEYKKTADEEWTTKLTNSTATTCNLTGLTPGTAYQARVQSVCSGNVSGWKTVSFSTMYGVPMLEEFSATSLPANWHTYNIKLSEVMSGSALTGTGNWSFGTGNGAFDGDNHAKLNIYGTSVKSWLVTPSLQMVNNVELTFDIALTVWSSSSTASPTAGAQADDIFAVLASTDGGTTWTILRQWDNAGSEYVYDNIPNGNGESVSINLSSYAGQNVAIAFYGESTVAGGDNNMHIDNVSIDYIPSCVKPSRLAYSDVTNHTATLSWQVNDDTQTAWDVQAATDEAFTTGVILKQNVTSHTNYVLTDLTAETPYYVRVRANCGGSDGVSNWSNVVNFTTDIACPAPTINVTEVKATSATIEWEGYASNYNLRYREIETSSMATITLTAGDVWGDGTGYQMLIDADATAYGDIIPETGGLTTSGDGSASLYAEFEYKIPTNADGALNTTNIVINNSVTILVPAGTYDWCITNPTPGDRLWIAGGNGNVECRQDDYVFEANKTYTFEMIYVDGDDAGDGANLTVTDNSKADPKANWITLNNVTSPKTITGLTSNTYYEVEVQALCGGSDGTSEWAHATFHTPDACEVPTVLDPTNIGVSTATLNWNGIQNSYNVKYRTAEARETFFFTDFDNNGNLPEGWSTTGSSSYYWQGTTDYWVFLGYTAAGTQYLITSDLSEYENKTIEFMQRYYGSAMTFKVGFSSTTTDVDAFEWGRDIEATSSESVYSITIPTGAKYFGIQATSTEVETQGIIIDDFGIYGETIPAGSWVTRNNVNSPLALTGLAGNTIYEWQVQGIESSCTSGVTDWSSIHTFTTLSPCQEPEDMDYEVVGTSVTLSWNGLANSYTLRYRTSEDAEIFFSEDFSSGELGDWTTVNAHESNIVDGAYYFHYTTTPPQYLISPELPEYESGSTLRFIYAAYNSSWPESFMVGLSTTGNNVEDFTWSDEVTTSNTSGAYYTMALPDGIKYFAIQCTSYDAFYLIVTNFLIYGPVTPAGEWVTLTNVTSPRTITGLEEETWYDWQVQATGCTAWYSGDSFLTEEDLGQVLPLVAGANWCSANVEITLDNLKAAIVAAMPAGTQVTINSKTQYSTYNGTQWRGTLRNLDLSQMFKISTDNAYVITLQGDPIDPADHPVTIKSGANWIAFPFSEEMTVANAFAGFAIRNDMVTSKTKYTTYTGSTWRGTFTKLEPGQGYVYKSAYPSNRTFTYPAAKSAPRGINMSSKWNINASTKLNTLKSPVKEEKRFVNPTSEVKKVKTLKIQKH